METKQYIIFYNYYQKGDQGNGWLDNYKITKEKNENVNMELLNENVQEEIIKRNRLPLDTKVVVTNIINQTL